MSMSARSLAVKLLQLMLCDGLDLSSCGGGKDCLNVDVVVEKRGGLCN